MATETPRSLLSRTVGERSAVEPSLTCTTRGGCLLDLDRVLEIFFLGLSFEPSVQALTCTTRSSCQQGRDSFPLRQKAYSLVK